eukprot:CAMPEP_0114474884 /NCGR_PEP_ID=MMETSP0104-20121206/13825_1 /TAXON_ID=37642 ORGANISM="Paraphysomonas imperforata, Strain PA2" /NCGR_SAMPLE_ID=MMETSP0104 /ASSEMBLY_ACC=CAM_ASM_000202 /LENGTH=93 /DNA_ID=CAMNT_0001649309 /DNA_START=371 /DNA_END=649 /DNA_ORIENTATION=+
MRNLSMDSVRSRWDSSISTDVWLYFTTSPSKSKEVCKFEVEALETDSGIPVMRSAKWGSRSVVCSKKCCSAGPVLRRKDSTHDDNQKRYIESR